MEDTQKKSVFISGRTTKGVRGKNSLATKQKAAKGQGGGGYPDLSGPKIMCVFPKDR